MRVYKVVQPDGHTDTTFYSAIMDDQWEVHYIPGQITQAPVGSYLFAFRHMEAAREFVNSNIGYFIIWAAETPETFTPPPYIGNPAYESDEDLFDKFWQDYHSWCEGECLGDAEKAMKRWREVGNHTPPGTVLCQELTLLEQIEDDEDEE